MKSSKSLRKEEQEDSRSLTKTKNLIAEKIGFMEKLGAGNYIFGFRMLRAFSDGPTDRPTDRPTDQPTNRVAYRVTCMRLKNRLVNKLKPFFALNCHYTVKNLPAFMHTIILTLSNGRNSFLGSSTVKNQQ